jgi:hypothetical protein
MEMDNTASAACLVLVVKKLLEHRGLSGACGLLYTWVASIDEPALLA